MKINCINKYSNNKLLNLKGLITVVFCRGDLIKVDQKDAIEDYHSSLVAIWSDANEEEQMHFQWEVNEFLCLVILGK